MVGGGAGLAAFEMSDRGEGAGEVGEAAGEAAWGAEGASEIKGEVLEDRESFSEAAVGEVPAATEHQPVGDHQRQQLGVDLAEHAGGFVAAPLVQLGVALPQLEHKLNLPA